MTFMGRDRAYVIAEISSNHGGSLDVALALIDAAADAGADAAKFQAGHADHVYDPAQFPKEHASFKRYVEPTLEWLPKLEQRCSDRGIDFGCSAFCFDALDAVDPYVKWHKIASIESTWRPFIRAVASKKKPMLISTGGLDRDGCHDILHGLDRAGLRLTTLLHCTIAYPADLGEVDLGAMADMDGSGDYGLSDHTTHPTVAPCAAVVMGASVIEKHLRPHVCEYSVPDFGHSIIPLQFREMVDAIRLTEAALGLPEKRVRKSERGYLKYRRGPLGLRGA